VAAGWPRQGLNSGQQEVFRVLPWLSSKITEGEPAARLVAWSG